MNEEKNIKKTQPITDPEEIPEGLSDEDQIAFWESHALTEDYLAKTEEVPPEERPEPRSPRTKPVSIRFADDTIDRLKILAEVKGGIGYQTLIKEFVDQRLYEEEKREGILPSDAQQSIQEVFENAFVRSLSGQSAPLNTTLSPWSVVKAGMGSGFEPQSVVKSFMMPLLRVPSNPIAKVAQSGNLFERFARDARNSYLSTIIPVQLRTASKERHE